MAKDRIYFVGTPDSGRLVRATRQGPALMHVARGAFTVRVATQNDLEALFAKGVKVEDPDAEPASSDAPAGDPPAGGTSEPQQAAIDHT